ncbi:Uncharacterised protein [Klebsiella pneumoniae]|uniref:Uncharacterized protein n=1 Tax=Klebsiella pneumoniae TaxID=573 RepID=A0A378FTS8_KLEPN|nr:Uncharacterised protein [Klebsiella pneumoniae]
MAMNIPRNRLRVSENWAQQDIFHHVHLAIDHHLYRGRRDADKQITANRPGNRLLMPLIPPQLNTDQKHGADIEEVERSVV